MMYKTIVLEILQQRPEMHERLRKERKLLPAMELYAQELKTFLNAARLRFCCCSGLGARG